MVLNERAAPWNGPRVCALALTCQSERGSVIHLVAGLRFEAGTRPSCCRGCPYEPENSSMLHPIAREGHARPTILGVEDDDATRDLLIGVLENSCHPIGARDGTEALAILASGVAEAVLLDLSLPDFDGREILRRLAGLVA